MVYSNPDEYLYNLKTCNSSDAKRLWRKSIKDEWKHKCAYCESSEDLTIDHIIPQSKGGKDEKNNVVCACKQCNHSKGHKLWDEWFKEQDFFTTEKMSAIVEWMSLDETTSYVVYRPRKNNTII
jgi:hypothetical protein